MSKVRVLEVNVNDHGYNGVFSLINNVIEHKPNDVFIDIAGFEKFEDPKNIEHLKKYGTNFYYIGQKGNKIQQLKIIYTNLYKFLIKNNYDYVHIHGDMADKLLILGLAAKKAGTQNIIFHSHASNVDGKLRWIKKIIHKTTAPFLKNVGTKFVAVSELAASWMYPNISVNKVVLIKNGIDLPKFRYDIKIRQEIRKELNLDDKYVLGHVGRFAYQKNHIFLLKVFKKWLENHPNSILLLVGEGKDKNKIYDFAKKNNILDNIIFYGTSNAVNELLQAMDIFLLPSHFEGLPIVGVEAQAAGLPVIFSDKITREAKVLNTTHYLPIAEGNISQWVNLIEQEKNIKRKDTCSEMNVAGFNIEDSVKQFVKLYEK